MFVLSRFYTESKVPSLSIRPTFSDTLNVKVIIGIVEEIEICENINKRKKKEEMFKIPKSGL